MKAANLIVRFVLEVSAVVLLASLAFGPGAWGGYIAVVRIAGVVGALGFVTLWGRYVAPRSSRRLRDPARVLLEIGLFGAAAVALSVLSTVVVAGVFAAIVALNELLLFALGQRDR